MNIFSEKSRFKKKKKRRRNESLGVEWRPITKVLAAG
jgi:hypothetical protein